MPECKRCSKCGEVKTAEGFSSDRRQKDGRARWCRACKANSARDWYRANPERHAATATAWRRANPEKVRAKDRRIEQAHPERSRERTRRNTAKLADCYVAGTLRMPLPTIPGDLLELKREQLLLRRLTRKLVQELENHDGN